MKTPYFYTEDHEYYCIVEDNDGNTFIGVAMCHPDDQDLESEKVGYHIALLRAQIKILQHYKNNILRPQLNGFNELYYSMNGKNFNENSYEARRVRKFIKRTQSDIQGIQYEIENLKSELREYLSDKETFREKIRHIRSTQNN